VVVVCVAMAVLGGLLAGNALKTWFANLVKPRFQIPMWLFYIVGAIVYIMDGIILYRLIEFVQVPQAKVVAITALLVVMLFNELWNYAFFGLRSTLAGFLGIIAFLAPLTILEIALLQYEILSGLLLLPYCAWVVLYNIPWARALWKLNSSESVSR